MTPTAAKLATAATFLFAILVGGGCARIHDLLEERRGPDRYLIPQDFVGWVQIDFGARGAALAKVEGKYRVFEIPPNGRLQTATPLETGSATDQYFYQDPQGGRREIPLTGWGKGGMIWAGSSPRWTPQNRPFVDVSKPAISGR